MTKHIVLVEDDSLLSDMYHQALVNEGFQCSVALDGAAGFELIERVQPDLVLLDLMLPQLSGDEVLEKLRNSERTKDTRVIIMTNISESEAPERLKSLTFDRYIIKANTTLLEVIDIIKKSFEPAAAQ